MRILAIETSCDETAVCILEAKGRKPKSASWRILSNIVASQVKIHAPWGGVVPNLAKREHQKNLPVLLRKALKQAQLSFVKPKIDLMAITNGPGLEPALWVGINFSQELAKKWKKPLIGINHLEGHIFSVFLKKNRESTKHEARSTKKKFEIRISDFEFPAIALLVSGGHTELVLMKEWLKYKIIGQTLDDAAGEAFDKVARLLSLGYPGGPVIAKEADKLNSSKLGFGENEKKIKLPRPMLNSKDYNFSFSGLKTAVLYLLRDLKQKSNYSLLVTRYGLLQSICAEFQQAVIDVLVKKTISAAREYRVKTIILGGGVAANKELRRQIIEAVKPLKNNPILLMPEMEFTGDNAAMIALPAYFRSIKHKKIGAISKIVADSNLKLV
jgi:N6-L-threonylcarbamoyladenine synthase